MTKTNKTVTAHLAEIQQKLKVPKSQKNTFGNYNYRSLEDIQEAVKPLLGECVLLLNDEIVQIGERYYIKATARLFLDNESVEVSAYAREQDTKKGMDQAQVTGAASSYARKYALNGLFAIDDSKDPDTQDNNTQETSQKVSEYDEVLNSRLWVKIKATTNMKELTNVAQEIAENKHKLSPEMLKKLQALGKLKRTEIEKGNIDEVEEVFEEEGEDYEPE